jgi:hypothetical protein
MPRVGLEPTIPEFEQAKTVHVSDPEATVISSILSLGYINTETSWLEVGRKADDVSL